MSESVLLFGFSLEGGRYALTLPSVKRAFRAVEITPLPKAPEIALGVINVEGSIVPAINMRKRFSLPPKEIDISDHFILAQSKRRSVIFCVDSVTGVIACDKSDIAAADAIIPGLEYLNGVAKLPDGLLLIHDIDECLSLDEELALDEALAQQ